MGLVNIRHRPSPGRKKRWRAQWYEKRGGVLRPREKWFASEQLALKFKSSHEAEAERFEELAMSATDRARWARLVEECRQAGTTIEAAVAEGIAALKKSARKSEPLETALGLWELDAAERKLRPKSVAGMADAVARFAKGREKADVSTFTGADLLGWVAQRYSSQRSRDSMLNRLITFFRWCAAAPRRWCALADFSDVKWEHRVMAEKKRVGFYSAAEAAAILEAVAPSLKPAVALGFFTGVRPAELMRIRLSWKSEGEFFGFDEKKGEWHLAAEWTKTRAYRRLYALPDCWWYWWIKYRDRLTRPEGKRKPKRHGMLVPMNYRNFRHAMKEARAAAGLERHPHDGIRHSFGTHGFHRSADGQARGVEWCIALMGHVGGFRIFEQSYNGKVSDVEAEAYFLIYPAGAACHWEPKEKRTSAHGSRIVVTNLSHPLVLSI